MLTADAGAKREHGYTLDRRQHMVLRGVKDADDFDEKAISLLTDMGAMRITGDGMRMLKLDLEAGLVVLEGHIDSVVYEKEKDPRGFFAKLFG